MTEWVKETDGELHSARGYQKQYKHSEVKIILQLFWPFN